MGLQLASLRQRNRNSEADATDTTVKSANAFVACDHGCSTVVDKQPGSFLIPTAEDQCRCPWLEDGQGSCAEMARRLLVIRRVCERLSSVSPAQRPRSMPAFANFTRSSRRVRTYTVNPQNLLPYLECLPQATRDIVMSQPVPGLIPQHLLESPSQETIRKTTRGWNRLLEEGWVDRNGAGEHARWIQANASNLCEYSAEELYRALCQLGRSPFNEHDDWCCFHTRLSGVLCTGLAESSAHKSLGCIPEKSWNNYHAHKHCVVRKVPMPFGCSGTFFGVGGTNFKAFVSQLQQNASKVCVLQPPQVLLNVKHFGCPKSAGTLTVTFIWNRWELKQVAAGAAAKVDAFIAETMHSIVLHISEIRSQRIEAGAVRRERRAEAAFKAGEEYHEQRLRDRETKRHRRNDSALRGLELPAAGLSASFGVLRPSRKEVGQQRRRAFMKEKRRQLLAACLELHPSAAQDDRTKQMRVAKPSRSGAGRRLARHLHACRGVVAEQAFETLLAASRASNTCPRRTARSERTSRQQTRLATLRWHCD